MFYTMVFVPLLRLADLVQRFAEIGEDVAPKAKRAFPPIVLVLAFFATAWGQDWIREEDWTRNGKMFFGVAGAGMMASVYIARYFHWTAAAFFLWVIGQWVRLRLAPVSFIEVTMISSAMMAAIFNCREDGRNLLARCLIIDGFLQSSLGLCEVAGFFPFLKIYDPGVWAPIAALGHPTLLGPYVALSLPFLVVTPVFPRRPRLDLIFRVLTGVLVVTCALFARSTMTYATLAAIILLTSAFLFRARVVATAAGALALAGGVIVWLAPTAADFNGRMPHYLFALRTWTWDGYGPGLWQPVAIQRYAQEWERFNKGLAPQPSNRFWAQVHSDPIQGLWEHGAAGVAPLAIGLLILAWITVKAIRLNARELMPWACIVFGIFVDSVGSFPLRTMPMGFLFAVAACRMFQHDFVTGAIRRHYRDLE